MSDNRSTVLKTYSLLSLIGAIALPLAGVFYNQTFPEAVDPMELRWLLAGWMALLPVLTYTDWWDNRLLLRAYQLNSWLITGWFGAITILSGFPQAYAFTFLVTIGLAGVAYGISVQTVRPLVYYYGFSTVLFCGGLWMASPGEAIPVFYFTAFWGTVILLLYSQRTMLQTKNGLKVSRDRWEALIAGHPEPILVVAERTIRYANRASTELLAGDRKVLQGISIGAIVRDQDFQRLHPSDHGDNATGTSPLLDTAVVSLDGQVRHVQMKAVATRFRGKEAMQLLMRDITDEKATKRKLSQSKRRLQALFDHALDVILLADDQGRYVDVNPAAERLLGYSREELVGTMLSDYSPGISKEEGLRGWEAFIQTGKSEGEAELLTRSGERVTIEYRGVANVLPGLHLSICRDITERKRLEAQADRFFSLTLDLFCIADTEGHFVRVNPAFEEVLGFTENELLKRPFVELIHPEDRTATRDCLERLSGGGDVKEFVNRYRTKRGDYRWIEWHATPDAEGQRIYAAARDVTDRHRHQEKLREAKEKAEEMNRLKSSFLANMSHEIRTPLTSIIGYADLLRELIPDDHSTYIQYIEESGHRLLTTLNSVLDLAQLESGAMKTSPERIDCSEEIRRTADTLRLNATEKDVDFCLNLPEDPLMAEMDPGILTRIITNLTSNAIKFTDEGYVQISCRPIGEEILIEIADTGIGMEAQFLDELYEAFRQESTGTAREYEGNGLGLTITKHLVDLMEGCIEVESQKGVGTTFTIRLPWKGLVEEPTRSQFGPELDEALPTNQTVLIIDDDPAVSMLLEEMLPEGYTVDAVGGAAGAFARMEKGSYDLLFLDINLKEKLDGRDVLERLRARDLLGGTTVIATTAYALPGDADALLEAGFDRYLAKPFTRENLYAHLARLTVKHTLRETAAG